MITRKFLTISCLLYSCLAGAETFRPPDKPVPITYFGMHSIRFHDQTLLPKVISGTWRLWDTGTSWVHIEPQQGTWDFRRFDLAVSTAKSRHQELIITLGRPPAWASTRPDEASFFGRGEAAPPRSLADFERYVETIAKRYGDNIKYFEVWNEPASSKMFSGNIQQMIGLVGATRNATNRVNPQIQIICPSPAKFESLAWFKEFLNQGGANHCDIIGYHFYTDHPLPEKRIELFNEVKKILLDAGISNKPIWDTESGINTQEQRNSLLIPRNAYLARWMLLTWILGIERFNWYAWDHGQRGFINPNDKTMHTDMQKTYEVVQKWMLGNKFAKCVEDSDLWRCDLRLLDGRKASIYWSQSSKEVPLDISSAILIEDISGFSARPSYEEIPITGSPIMVVWKQ